MIQNWTCSSGEDYVNLMWNCPDYDPERYELYYSCKLQSDPYYYISSKLNSKNSTSTFARVSELLPGSLCLLTLVAVYNPASIDPGLTVVTKTLQSSTAKSK